MVIEGSVFLSHPIEEGGPESSPLSPIDFAMDTAGQVM